MLIRAIKSLPEDEPKIVKGVWYKTQKEHWLGWLRDYSGPGAYGRKTRGHDARFVYNHIVCPEMLIYLIDNIPIEKDIVVIANNQYKQENSLMAKAGLIRKVVPWEEIEEAILR